MRVELEGRKIPRNANGDPAFADITALKEVFNDAEITELVNRSLYQIEYQKASHRKRAQTAHLLEMPLKRAYKALYPHQSWAKANEKELREAMKHLEQHPELAREEFGK